MRAENESLTKHVEFLMLAFMSDEDLCSRDFAAIRCILCYIDANEYA